MKRLIGSVLTCIAYFTSFAQTDPTFLGLSLHSGFIIPHSEELKPISTSTPVGIQLEYSKLKLGEDAWSTCNCYGRAGWSFLYMNYQNPQVLGNSYNLIYFVQPYLFYSPKLSFSLKTGLGISYLDQVYDEESNPENLFFSAPLSFFLFLSPSLGYLISDHWEISIAGNYNHISNGGSRQPNKGMNFPSLSVGVSRVFNYQVPEKRKKDREIPQLWEKYSGIFGSLRSADESTEGSNYLMIGLNGGVLRALSVLNGLNAGIELSFDDSYRERLERLNQNDTPWIGSLMLGHHFTIGKFYFFQQFGFYLLKPDAIQRKNTFQRYSIYYRMFDHIGLGTSLIAHGHVADHMDIRVAYFW